MQQNSAENLHSNLKSNLQIWLAKTRTLKTSNLNRDVIAPNKPASSAATSRLLWG